MTLRFFLIFGEIAIEKYAETASEIDYLLFAFESGAKIYILCKKNFRVKLTIYLIYKNTMSLVQYWHKRAPDLLR